MVLRLFDEVSNAKVLCKVKDDLQMLGNIIVIVAIL